MKNIALFGHGYWGKNIARNLNELGRLGYIVDYNEEMLDRCREQYPGVECTSKLADIIHNDVVQAVFLATPAVTHASLAIDLMNAGKDVFVEKPMCINTIEGQEMLKVSKATGRILMVGHLLLYHPVVRKLKEMIQTGKLGKIQYIYSNRLNFGKIRVEENSMWSFAPHDISVINYLLNDNPLYLSTSGSAHLTKGIHDYTMTNLEYNNEVKAHIFVNWLHPYKEQRLVVIGNRGMAVFSDTSEDKLLSYEHKIDWLDQQPIPNKADAVKVQYEEWEPLRRECEVFLEAIQNRKAPLADVNNGLDVVKVLNASDRSLKLGGLKVHVAEEVSKSYFVHDRACVDDGAIIGGGTKIWHYSHIMSQASIGENCSIGQNVNIDKAVKVGNNVKIQNNVSLYSGVEIEDDVFLGPSCVFTNVSNPRSQIKRQGLYEKTLVKKGSSIGANATIVCGVTLGKYSFIGAGAVVTKDIPDYALAIGNPAKQTGWMSRHGHILKNPDTEGIMICPESGLRYQVNTFGNLICLDLSEEACLPEEQTVGRKAYSEYKESIKK